MAQTGPRGLAHPGYGKMPGIRGLSPIGVIEEGWAMSVDRLAGSGTAGGDTEPARKRRAQRRGTGRRRGGDASAVGLAEPGQAGEATAAPESNVILLGQEAGPGPSAATPERPPRRPRAGAGRGHRSRRGGGPHRRRAPKLPPGGGRCQGRRRPGNRRHGDRRDRGRRHGGRHRGRHRDRRDGRWHHGGRRDRGRCHRGRCRPRPGAPACPRRNRLVRPVHPRLRHRA